MESVEPFLLIGICGPCLTAIEQGAEDAGIVHSHLHLHGQLGVCPHSWCQVSECCGWLPDPLVNLSIKGKVIGDGGPKVHELVNDFELIVIDGDDWGCRYVLAQDICLLQTDDQPKVFAGHGEAVHEQLQFPLGVCHNCSIISKQHVSDEGFTDLCPRF